MNMLDVKWDLDTMVRSLRKCWAVVNAMKGRANADRSRIVALEKRVEQLEGSDEPLTETVTALARQEAEQRGAGGESRDAARAGVNNP